MRRVRDLTFASRAPSLVSSCMWGINHLPRPGGGEPVVRSCRSSPPAPDATTAGSEEPAVVQNFVRICRAYLTV